MGGAPRRARRRGSRRDRFHRRPDRPRCRRVRGNRRWRDPVGSGVRIRRRRRRGHERGHVGKRASGRGAGYGGAGAVHPTGSRRHARSRPKGHRGAHRSPEAGGLVIPRLLIATKNTGKRQEMEAILRGMGLAEELGTGLDLPDVDEVGETLEENAILKARTAAEATGLPALADDTGLEVDHLGGAPGVHTARYAGPDATFDDNMDKLLRELEGVDDRSARFVTVVALAFPDGEYVTAEGVVAGRIAEQRRGETGFGYDPVFEIDGRTYAEMSAEEKNRFSHRARALAELGRTLGL